MKRTDLIATLRRLLAPDPGVVAAYLYGSRARGEERPTSDVDLGVLFAETPAPKLDNAASRLESRLELALGLVVQVTVINTAPPDLVHRVFRDGVILRDADPGRRIRFEVAARNRYFDLLPHLARYRRAG